MPILFNRVFMGSTFWVEAVSKSNRSTAQLVSATYVGYIFSVWWHRRKRCCMDTIVYLIARIWYATTSCIILSRTTQITSFSIAALYSGTWCFRLAITSKDQHFWKRLGLFSKLIFFGSITGVVSLWANMERYILIYEGEIQNFGLNSSKVGQSKRRVYNLFASAIPYFVAFQILFSVSFICFIVAELMLLDRLVHNAVKSSKAQANTALQLSWLQRLPVLFKILAGAAVASSVVSLAASSATSVYMSRAAPLYHQAAAACGPGGEDTASSVALNGETLVHITQSRQAESIKATCDAIAFLLIAVTFAGVVCWIVALFHKVEQIANRALLFSGKRNFKEMQSPESGAVRIDGLSGQLAIRIGNYIQTASKKRQHLTRACIIMLITFPARAALEVLTSVSFFAVFNSDCNVQEACQSNEYLISIWMFLTPEFRPIVVSLSSPVPMMMSLWLVSKMHSRDNAESK
jgi:hypothetical protein